MSTKSRIPAAYILTVILLFLLAVAGLIGSFTLSGRADETTRKAEALKTKNDAVDAYGGVEGLCAYIEDKQTAASDGTLRLSEIEEERKSLGLTIGEQDAQLEEDRKKLDETRADNGKAEKERLASEYADLLDGFVDLKLAFYDKLGQKNFDPAEPKIAYLTFDDGPSANTDKILDILAKYDIKATFFVNWHSGSTNAARYKRIVDEGHTLGNHTASHDWDIVYKDPESFMDDVKSLSENLYEITGYYPTVFRFPGGSTNTKYRYRSKGEWSGGVGASNGRDLMHQLARDLYANDFVYFDWNVNSTDADSTLETKENIVKAVLRSCRNFKTSRHAIILMHDLGGKKTTVEALPEIIEGLIADGWSFKALTPDTPPYRSKTPETPKIELN